LKSLALFVSQNQLVSKLNGQINNPEKLVLVGLGSNLEPEKNLSRAIFLFSELAQIIKKGFIWQTPAVGSEGPDYLNTAILIKTGLPLDQFKNKVLSQIEDKLGRVRQEDRYADRTIDLDVLVFDNQVIDDELWTQPHVAVPAADVAPELKNPRTGEKISQAAARLLPGTQIFKRTDLS
jgi:2-amino-4-hydroxy-6-hydroxymethyldihydropteridine diphosphokinase